MKVKSNLSMQDLSYEPMMGAREKETRSLSSPQKALVFKLFQKLLFKPAA